MKNFYEKNYFLRLFVLLVFFCTKITLAQNWDQSELNFNGLTDVSSGVTAMEFGPDNRLYVAEYPGLIKVMTIERQDSKNYNVIEVEVLNGVQTMEDHNDDGTIYNSIERETTGLTVGGTAVNPVIYVASSDFRIGAGSGGGNGDVGLDTNSGVITRFTWTGTEWNVVDLVRGLPRSEENHATNGLEVAIINGVEYLIVAQGGHTNGGAPSENFVFTCEYALSGAILAINLDELNGMPILNDNGRSYIYDLPTLDDPTRPNINGITDPNSPGYDGVDVNDPFGGNDGLNQAVVVPGGPVQILSPGYRNAYDIVLTESGALYVTDNGANLGWGGLPEGEGTANVTNAYNPLEPGSSSPVGGEVIDNQDHLTMITNNIQSYSFNSFYGGHPNPTRANPNGAGLFTEDGGNSVFRTLTYDPDGSTPGSTTDASIALPANWPPVTTTNSVEGDWRGPSVPNNDGPNDVLTTIWGTNTNAIVEYTATNFNGELQGDLLAGSNKGQIRRVQLNSSGGLESLDEVFLTGYTGDALAIAANGDNQVFPGTIWLGTLGGTNTYSPSGGGILIYEPLDFIECIAEGEPGYDPLADGDADGYTNQDEIDNGTGECNGGSQPSDFDKAAGAPFISNLNDMDDDSDGIPDAQDPFQLGNPTQGGSDAFTLPVFNDFFNNQQGLGGYAGLGLTGLMNNGDVGANWLNWIDMVGQGPNPNDVIGGAPGLMTSHMSSGTAAGNLNTQTKGYQLGVQVDNTTGKFTVIGKMQDFNEPLGLYQHPDAINPELGFYIGDGTQSNYIEFVVTRDGFKAFQELNDVIQPPITKSILGTPNSGILFYFIVDPATGIIDLEYKIDDNPRAYFTTITASGSILNAITSNTQDLAIGLIGTSGNVGSEVMGTWDFINVLGSNPIVKLDIPNLDRIVDTANESIDLLNYFEDDLGAQNLSFSIESNTNTAVGAIVNGSNLNLSYPSTSEISEITIRATDVDGNFVEDSFVVNVVESYTVLYRVNAGGPEIAAIDGNINWSEDTTTNPSEYLSSLGGNSVFSGSVNTLDSSIDAAAVPIQLFNSERFDNDEAAPGLSYSFPVTNAGNYEVRIYLGNGFSGTSEQGERVFDVKIEGKDFPLLKELDLSGTYGNNVGTMISHIVKVNDGSVDLQFLHSIIENPLVNAIEIVDAPDTDTPIYVFDIDDQISFVNQQLGGSLGVQAVGGDGNLTYTATGFPNGVFIEPTNGQIGGEIEESALANSPFNVTITVNDSDGLNGDVVTTSFEWNVIEPSGYRVNVGGSQLMASDDIIPFWEPNNASGLYNGGSYTVNTGTIASWGGIEYENRHSSIPAYIDENTFNQIFNSERYDPSSGDEMQFSFPVENGDYVVNLYVGNSFNEANTVGARIFDIVIEGNTVQENFDVVDIFGAEVGGMLTYPISVTDNELNILLEHVVENPLLNAIEIFNVDSNYPEFLLDPITNQSTEILQSVNLNNAVSGGNPGEVVYYTISGQPEGISIDSETGVVSGTVSASATAGGPNDDGIHNVIVSALKKGSAPATVTFQWTITADLVWIDKDENENYEPRHENSFVQAGDKFFVMGGRETAKDVDIYDYTSDTWIKLEDSAPFELNHFQAVSYKGLIWVIGAFQSNAFPSEVPAQHIWMFNPSTEAWIQGPEIPESRRRGSAGLVMHEDKFYVVCGNTIGHNGGYTAMFDVYDPMTGEWTALTDAPHARDHFAAVLIDDKIYAAGGRLSGGPGGVWNPTIPEVDVYDLNTSTWATLPSNQNLPTPRGGASAVNFNNKLIVIGGEVKDEVVDGVLTDDALKITEQYDPIAAIWKRLPDMNHDRHGTQAIVSGGGIYIAGGAQNRGGGNQLNMEVLGADSPSGTPLAASTLSAPSSVLFTANTTESVEITVADGNTAVFIKSIEITGTNANDFNFDNAVINNSILDANTDYSIPITFNSEEENRNALLTITYDDGQVLTTVLTNNPNLEFGVENPGNQYNYEGEDVTLQIEASSQNGLTFSATGLPPTLTINPNTGIISGTISDGSGTGSGSDAFVEENGLVIIEAENTDTAGWDITNLNGKTGIIANTNSFGSQNGSTIDYDIQISTPGVYRFNWHSFYTGEIASEENDNWLKFPNNSNVWFFGIDDTFGNPGSEADIIANIQGAQNGIVFPGGSTRVSAATTPAGSSTNGFFKIFRSGGASQQYDWQARTSDNDSHAVYVYFVNPGTYTMQISERSAGHAIDRIALYKVDTYGYNYNADLLTNVPESNQGSQGPGAADNSPYNVVITVEESGNPNPETIDFEWIVGNQGDLIAVPEANVTEGFVPLTVQFTAENSKSGGNITNYLWNFGDGNTSEEITTSHTFTALGQYTVSLTVEDENNNTDTQMLTISVTGTGIAPNAIAATDIILGESPLEVQFDASASTDDLGIASYSWDFKDGILSEEVNPLHTFTEIGIYDVELTVTDVEGLTATTNISVTVDQNPTAILESNILSGTAPLEILFTGDASTDNGSITSYIWDFGDGNTSIEPNPNHIYTETGEYTVTLIITDNVGLQNSATTVISVVEEGENLPPVAVITANPTSGQAPLPVIFNANNSTDEDGLIVAYAWEFGDGRTSTESNPVITYNIPGSYQVSLTVTDDEGKQNTSTIEIEVTEAINLNPIADISINTQVGNAPLEIVLSGEGSTDDNDDIVGYVWDFGDGNTATGVNVAYTYPQVGEYTITLTVEDRAGLTGTAQINVEVLPEGANLPPVAIIETSVSQGETPLIVDLSALMSTDDEEIVNYTWNFGDDSTGTGAETTHTYNIPGEYTVTLTVEDNQGLTAQATVLIVVNAPTMVEPVAVITSNILSGSTPLTVELSGNSSSDADGEIISYTWDFGDGSELVQGTEVMYTYTLAGTYTVTLTVTDDEGLTGIATVIINVSPGLESLSLDNQAAIIPNPATDGFTNIALDLDNGKRVTKIHIHDSSGRLQKSLDANNLELSPDFVGYRIPVDYLRDELYFVTIEFTIGDPISLQLLVKN
ncbi:PKD domain-containing protein [Croceivirga sp. JEA036]|uniref:PKD domain-containing protein n=1 Tax=Croceivirga sp. JEA036 TaxID=2721162 RepID=UPI00143CA36A|nr:PKD domain-containing protein [Croceivirga sp. JEA036]NJB35376.1 PKD domain-containing protein [Croceivirga sp. JEA036]